jgi:hypothetical protein
LEFWLDLIRISPGEFAVTEERYALQRVGNTLKKKVRPEAHQRRQRLLHPAAFQAAP